MTNYINTMTLAEKEQVLSILSSGTSRVNPESLGFGVSAYDGTGRWLAGMVYKTTITNEILLSVLPEVQGTGIWMDQIPAMSAEMFNISTKFTAKSNDQKNINFLKKLGYVSSRSLDVNGTEEISYVKNYTLPYVTNLFSTSTVTNTILDSIINPPTSKALARSVTTTTTATITTITVLYT